MSDFRKTNDNVEILAIQRHHEYKLNFVVLLVYLKWCASQPVYPGAFLSSCGKQNQIVRFLKHICITISVQCCIKLMQTEIDVLIMLKTGAFSADSLHVTQMTF